MISNRFYYYLTLVAATFILSSCLDSDNNNVEYEYSADAQITSLRLSSSEDSLKVLPGVEFSINQVSSAPIIFNKDSLPYLFDVENVSMNITTNNASGIKIHLSNDSSYIWNMTDSVLVKKLRLIEVYAQDGKTKKTYTFKLTTHQQDPDTIFWQNVENNYIPDPTDQITVSNKSSFFTYHKTNSTLQLSTSLIVDGETWTIKPLIGLPQNVVLNSIRNEILEERDVWFALDTNNKVYLSENGVDWTEQSTDYPIKAIFGNLPSFTKDSVLTIVKDGDKYKFAKTIDFSTMHVLNEIPVGFPIEDFTSAKVKDLLIYTAKYLIVTGGKSINGILNRNIWLLQESEDKITFTTKRLQFNVLGSSLFNYDNKIYLLTSEDNKNVFYTSTNYGVFWEKANSKQSLPIEFINRTNHSVHVDSKNNIWIFGGVSSNQRQFVEIWKGRINKLFVQ